MFKRRAPLSAEARKAEQVKLVGPELAEALPNDGGRWWTKSYLVRLNSLLGICCVSAATLGYDGVLMNALQISPSWKIYYDHPTNARLGAMNAMMPVGKVIGSFVVSPFSNRFGRKKALVVGFTLAVIGATIQAGAVNYALLVVSRLILGFGAGFMSQPSPILLAELAYPTHRGKVTALYNTFFYFGAIAAAWISFGTLKMEGDWAWRIPTLLQGAAPAFQLLFSYFLPESPRYLIARGRVDEARDLLVKHHADGDQDSPLVTLEILQIQEALRIERDAEHKSLWRILASPANRWRLSIVLVLSIAAQWSGNSVVSYYLTLVLDAVGITDPTQQSLINGGLQIFNMLACIFCGALLVDKLGRRVLFLWSAAGMCLTYVVWTIINSRFAATQSKEIGYAVIPMIFVFYFHYAIALTPLLYAYPTEIFPYELRGLGVSLTLIGANITLVIGQVANPVAMSTLGWKFYIFFCVIDALFFVTVWFLFPETKGKSLEEVAEIFEKNHDGHLIAPEKMEAVLSEKATHVEVKEKL